MRVGTGYDVHRLAAGRKLVLGGVEVPFDGGLDGHSDADVLLHAIMDAMLGAAGLSDIGSHFPPGDPRYKDASSLALLHQVADIIRGGGWRVANIDATIIAERPRLLPFIPDMKARIAGALGIEPGQVGIKATTNEGLGFVGREEGMAACAVALLEGNSEGL